MFVARHTLTSPSRAPSAADVVAGTPVAPAGVFDKGLITILDHRSAESLLQNWTWLRPNMVGLATTAFGDAFVWDRVKRQIHFLNVQYGTLEFVDDEVPWFLNNFLETASIVEKVLRRPRFERLVQMLRPLEYLEAFLLEPWPMLGGLDEDENYTIGKCDVYIDLVGQTLSQARF